MKDKLCEFIEGTNFPCIMARALIGQGKLEVMELDDLNVTNLSPVLLRMWSFVDELRETPGDLHSIVLVIKNDVLSQFSLFEKAFWSFITELHRQDKKSFPHDPRVDSNPASPNWGFSIKAEAFFIVALHPESPRWARRFKYPALVFNPHQQFERLRAKGLFTRIRDTIRQWDFKLQGNINPMLSDFGEKSEVFQYLGKMYSPQDEVPLCM